MANVSHASLTGSELHEPKGADTAALGTVYVANGAGSGSWSSIGTSAFTGMIADFAAPVAPSGWLELDGSIISTSTYSGLYAVMSITTSGTRTNGSAVVTSIPDTANLRVGYYVFGTGIASGTTILSVDSASQITLSGNASSSGSSSFAVSPWLLNTGTIKLPDLTTQGYYRRSRTSTTKVGDTLADQNKAHTHSVSGTTGVESAAHRHQVSGNTELMNGSTTHSHSYQWLGGNGVGGVGGGGNFGQQIGGTTGSTDINHTHGISLLSDTQNVNHTHTFSATTGSDGATEARPVTMVVLTCVKT
jgi:hypothetical protein